MVWQSQILKGRISILFSLGEKALKGDIPPFHYQCEHFLSKYTRKREKSFEI